MRILIENTVPLNNGDAALIFALGEQFEKKGCEVFYATFDYQEVVKKYPEKNWLPSLLSNKIINRLPLIHSWHLKYQLKKKPIYASFDGIVSAPGGYINSFYGIEKKLKLLRFYKEVLKQNVYLYSQSIGALNGADQERLKDSLPIFSLFYVRDQKSLARIKELGTYQQVFLTKDAAFLFEPEDKKINPQPHHQKKLAISVREWTEKKTEVGIFKQTIMEIVKFCHSLDYQIVFLSTCQGNSNYKDDAKIATEIIAELTAVGYDTTDIVVDDQSYSLNQFRLRLKDFDAVIGTRLHMCILAWLAGVPAFNISYEEKGKECYKYLDLSEFSINYGKSDAALKDKLTKFLQQESFKHTKALIQEIHQEDLFYFEKMYQHILAAKVGEE